VAADHHDLFRLGRERQDAGVVLQQHHALLGGAGGDLAVGCGVEAAGLDRVIHHARGKQAAQNAVDHVVDAGRRNLAGSHRGAQGLVEIDVAVQFLAGFLVQAGGRGGGGVDRAPVGHHPALPAPVALQDVVQKGRVLAGVDAVDAVVGAHDRQGLAALNGDLEGQQVGLPRRIRRHVSAGNHPAGFLVVQGEVLGGGGHAGALDAPDRGAVQGPGQQRVFAEIFEVAAVARLAGDVGAAGQQDIEALLPRLLADHGAAVEQQLGVEGGGQGEAGGQGGGVVMLAAGVGHAQAGVALPDIRNAQARNAVEVAGDTRDARRAVMHHARHVAVQQAVFLVSRHLRLQQVGAFVGGEFGVHPRLGGV
jgi:hypothetical protein